MGVRRATRDPRRDRPAHDGVRGWPGPRRASCGPRRVREGAGNAPSGRARGSPRRRVRLRAPVRRQLRARARRAQSFRRRRWVAVAAAAEAEGAGRGERPRGAGDPQRRVSAPVLPSRRGATVTPGPLPAGPCPQTPTPELALPLSTLGTPLLRHRPAEAVTPSAGPRAAGRRWMDRWGWRARGWARGWDSTPLLLAPPTFPGSHCFFPGRSAVLREDPTPHAPPTKAPA